MNGFQKLQRWWFITFPPNATRKPKERELSLLLKDFSTQVGWYNPIANTIGEAFFREIALLEKQLRSINGELSLSAAREIQGVKREDLELEWFTQLILHLIFQSHGVSEESFSFQTIKKILTPQDPINLQQARERFFQLITICSLDHLKPWEDTLILFWIIYSLDPLDWKNLRTTIKPVNGHEVTQVLEDIYFVTGLLTDHQQWVLPEVIRPLHPQFILITEILKKLNGWIPNLLKCLNHDISYKPKIIQVYGHSFHDRVRELNQQFESDLVAYRQEQDHQRITGLVEKLFPVGSLQDFPVYNATTQEAFRLANFQGLTQLSLASLLYSFGTILAKEKIKPLLQGLSLHGTFISEVGRNQFIDVTDRYEGINQELWELVEEFSSPSQSVLLNALALLQTPILDEKQKKVIRNAQQVSNKKINQLAKDTLNGSRLLITMLETCNKDLASNNPQLFKSLHTMKRHHPEVIELLSPSLYALEYFVEILGIFVPESLGPQY